MYSVATSGAAVAKLSRIRTGNDTDDRTMRDPFFGECGSHPRDEAALAH